MNNTHRRSHKEAFFYRRRASRYPAILQGAESDCGATCMVMVLRYFGKYVSLNQMRELVNVSRNGATLDSLAEAAEAVGIHTYCISASYQQLKRLELPCIAHWKGTQFVVIYESCRGSVIVADPAIGLRRLTREEFTKSWTGRLLLLAPTEKLEGFEESESTTSKLFLQMFRPFRKILFQILLASLMLQLFQLAAPIFVQITVDKILIHKNVSMLNMVLTGMLMIAVFQTVTLALRHYLMIHTIRRMDLKMVGKFNRHVFALPLRYFEEHKVGDILERFSEFRKIREILTGGTWGVVLDCVLVTVYFGLMFYYNAKLTFIVLAFIPGYIALAVAMTPVMKRRHGETFKRWEDAQSCLVESVMGIGTLKAMAAESSTSWKLEGLMVKALNAQFRSVLLNVTAYAVGNILHTFCILFIFWYGAYMVFAGELSVGQLVAFNLLVSNVTRPIFSVIELWNEFQQIGVSLKRLNDIFGAKTEEASIPQALIQLPPVRGHIKFEKVAFRYHLRGDKDALQNINLEIYPGQTVSLVGRSGAGKTTLANLILRLHEPSQGRILVDGYDLRHVSLHSLRSQVGIVPQDVFLFSGTVRENIAIGEPDAPLREVISAAMLAGAHDFISEFPLGYQSIIGARGQNLSGGQRQRIAIARALFKKPRILIFDEATSALDRESEQAIKQTLNVTLKDRTTFIITHRLSYVQNSDLIVVLEEGNIVETGTHSSLMKLQGLYWQLSGQQVES